MPCVLCHVPSSWCAPTCAHGLGGSTDVETLYRLSLASPGHSAQCSPLYGNHLNTSGHLHVSFVCLFVLLLFPEMRAKSWKEAFTHTCWADEQSLPCCCVWSTLAALPLQIVPGQTHENLFRSETGNIRGENSNDSRSDYFNFFFFFFFKFINLFPVYIK